MKKVELSGWDPTEPTCGFGTPSEYEQTKKTVIKGLKSKEYTRLKKLRDSINCVIWIRAEKGYLIELGLGLTTGDPICSIPQEVWEFEKLKSLSVDRKEIKEVPYGITKLKSLEILSLTDNRLRHFPESIINVTSLKNLDLTGNEIAFIPYSIVKLKGLHHLSLTNNLLKTLTEAIGELKSLKTLYLGYNELEQLPESFGSLESLTRTSVKDNHLRSLPKSIGNLKNLSYFALMHNHLKRLPEEISGLESLESLLLDGNNISELPNSITELKSLKLIQLYRNPIKFIPEGLKKDSIRITEEEHQYSDIILTEKTIRILEKLTKIERVNRLKDVLSKYKDILNRFQDYFLHISTLIVDTFLFEKRFTNVDITPIRSERVTQFIEDLKPFFFVSKHNHEIHISRFKSLVNVAKGEKGKNMNKVNLSDRFADLSGTFYDYSPKLIVQHCYKKNLLHLIKK